MGLESEIGFVGKLIVLQGGERLGRWEAGYLENGKSLPASVTITFDDAFFSKRDIGVKPAAEIIRDAAAAANSDNDFLHRCVVVTGGNFVSLAPPARLPANASLLPENAARVIAARVIEGVANRVIGHQPFFAVGNDKPDGVFENAAGEVAAPAGPMRRLSRRVGAYLLDRMENRLARMIGPALAIGLATARRRQNSASSDPH